MRYCERSEASRIRRFRYICGGEEGSDATGSEGCDVAVASANLPLACAGNDGIGEGERDATEGIDMPGLGAPLTIWSSLEREDMSGASSMPFDAP